MSTGSSALGTLLVQRLDAVLGTTLAQQANLMSGARSDAVSQAAQLARVSTDQDATHTDLRHSVERVAQHSDPRALVRGDRLKGASGSDPGSADGARTSSASTQLGNTARLILALLAQYPNRVPVTSGSQPLWQTPELPVSQTAPSQAGKSLAASLPDVATLARTLDQTVATSGMFYESHLADLAFGKRSPKALAAEPQARLTEPNVATSSVSATVLPHAEAALLVRQQLEVLAYQMFCWQGQAWPDASMDWEIQRHDGEDADQHRDAQHWASRINLTLPNLGDVQVRLLIVGETLSLQLSAPDCAQLLQAHGGVLRERCEAHGMTLTQFSVDADMGDMGETGDADEMNEGNA